MDREGGNKEKMRKCREWISLHFLNISPIPLHFLTLAPFPHSLSIASSFSHSLSIFSQPGWQAGTTCAALLQSILKRAFEKVLKMTKWVQKLRSKPFNAIRHPVCQIKSWVKNIFCYVFFTFYSFLYWMNHFFHIFQYTQKLGFRAPKIVIFTQKIERLEDAIFLACSL